MFEKPHINDFYENLRWHLERSARLAEAVVGTTRSNLAGSGRLESGAAARQITGAVQKEFESGVDRALGELRRVLKLTDIEPRDLRQASLQCLKDYTAQMKTLMDQDGMRERMGEFLDSQQRSLDEHLQFTVRQFDVGFAMPDEPEIPQISNAINVQSMVGSAIQQGSAGAHQDTIVRIDFESARRAVAALEEELHGAPQGISEIADLMADVATLKSQLNKSRPSVSVLMAAGKSAKKIAESVATNVITSRATQAIAALGTAIGF